MATSTCKTPAQRRASDVASGRLVRRLHAEAVTMDGHLEWSDGDEYFPALSQMILPRGGAVLEIYHTPNQRLSDPAHE